MSFTTFVAAAVVLIMTFNSCGGSGSSHPHIDPPAPVCKPGVSGGSDSIQEPVLIVELSDLEQESWLASPAVVDLDQDGENELIVARDDSIIVWHLDNSVILRLYTGVGRIWASPVVADLLPEVLGLEIAAASRDEIYAWDASGKLLSGFPVTWQDEIRSLASADGVPEIVFAAYSPDNDKSELFIIDAVGNLQKKLPLPGRGAMAVPTIEDVDGDGALEIIVSLKDENYSKPQVLVYRVNGSERNCLLWPTGRGNLLRNGNVL